MPKKGVLSARSRASIMFDFIKRQALEEFDGDADIHVLPKGQTVKFLFRDQVLIRFKKANSKGIGSNIETQAVLEFIDPQLKIPDLVPEIFKVEVCYTLDRLATKVAAVSVTKRDRHSKLWSYPIFGEESGVVVPLPTRAPDPESSSLVRPRKPIDKPETGE
ncbi:hypothetical protein EOA85_25870 [Mesorhizobium sp. M5C.F.Ca.IN.020.29.1.1]|uniref:hypothetical protein n=1 Tax=unclassified Mesorhizobium TaxID=325217 RepID=UPI000FCC5A4E|nr:MULTISPECIES: hypothetical protein [unclassified Mesorhizobium]RUV54185.1 hypothetical protein EOA85_25870 [Mesorhizobium sp. M5C.F.Ca.IN.020.29.1.1]TIM86003.1 MAG: hypothetical protein E5Y50_17060 [Mesorhizobium sp.]